MVLLLEQKVQKLRIQIFGNHNQLFIQTFQKPIMQSLIHDQKLKPLKEFYNPTPLFQDAQKLPQFFMTNLVDTARVVKYFHQDPQANIKIFYYQYLKLCFQIDNVDYESYILKIYEIIRTPQFEFYFDPNDPLIQLKNKQFRTLLVDFFEMMNSSSMTIDLMLSRYPILNEVFTNLFRSLAMIAGISPNFDSYIEKNDLFNLFSQYFSVAINSYDKCLKFVQSDIFVYEEDPQNIYMAYIKDEGWDARLQPLHSQNNVQIKDIAPVNEKQRKISNTSADYQGSSAPLKIQQSNKNSNMNIAKLPKEQQKNSLKPQTQVQVKGSFVENQFSDFASSSNLSSFGKCLPNDGQKQVTIECLEPNTTINEYQKSQVSPRPIDQQYTQQIQKQLKRVHSANNNILINCKKAQFTELMEEKHRQSTNNLTKVLSNPNLSASITPSNRLVESYNNSMQIKVYHADEKIPVDEKLQVQQQSQEKLMASIKSRNTKKNTNASFEEPTKDLGLFIHSNISNLDVIPVQSELYPQETTNLKQEKQTIEKKQPLKYKPGCRLESKQQFTKPLTQEEPVFHNPLTKTQNFPNNLSSNRIGNNRNHEKDPFTFNPVINPSILPLLPPSYSQKFKLNVTKQFTNSFVMNSMKQPFKTNVYLTRERARQFRKSIYNQFTYKTNLYEEEASNSFINKLNMSRNNLLIEPGLEKTLHTKIWSKSNYLKQKQLKQYTPITMLKNEQKVQSEHIKQTATEQNRQNSSLKLFRNENKAININGAPSLPYIQDPKTVPNGYQSLTQTNKIPIITTHQPILTSKNQKKQQNLSYFQQNLNNQRKIIPPYQSQFLKNDQQLYQTAYQTKNFHKNQGYQQSNHNQKPYVPYAVHIINQRNISTTYQDSHMPKTYPPYPTVSLNSHLVQKAHLEHVGLDRKK